MSKNKNYPFDSDCNDVYQSTIHVTEVKITTDPENKIEIAGWIDASCDDGPGIRSVLFFQGCSKNCPGCHNAKTHKRGEGSWYAVDELARKISAGCHSKMITISGGEPLEQESGLVALLKELKLRNFNICLYTGKSLEQVPYEVMGLIDFLKVGGFEAKLRTGNLQYYGSSNQKMYAVADGNIIAAVV